VAFRAAGIDDWRRFVESAPGLMRPLDVQNLCGDSSKARSKLGWMPQVTFEDMIEEMVNAQSRH
jgi:GDPmannose 4,6-dehydratase